MSDRNRKTVTIGGRPVGPGYPVYVVAEIGLNHNGDLDLAKRLIDAAHKAGCNAVKFQKRTPELCVPPDQKTKMRETPWGYISYLEYRYKVEFGTKEYREIDDYCRRLGLTWFASCWDPESVEFLRPFNLPAIKIPSAAVTDFELLAAARSLGCPIVMSSGMSTLEQIRAAVGFLKADDLILCHSTSTYPCPLPELNLKVITALKREFDCPIGYSGHDVGLATTVATVALGASLIERHITLDRSMWGSDQAASVEPQGFARLVKDIRNLEIALGDGIKRVYDSEIPIMSKLRRVRTD
jgi:N-acetylneuraminate synthase